MMLVQDFPALTQIVRTKEGVKWHKTNWDHTYWSRNYRDGSHDQRIHPDQGNLFTMDPMELLDNWHLDPRKLATIPEIVEKHGPVEGHPTPKGVPLKALMTADVVMDGNQDRWRSFAWGSTTRWSCPRYLKALPMSQVIARHGVWAVLERREPDGSIVHAWLL